MTGRAVDALVDAAEAGGGVDFDGLVVTERDGEFAFAAPGTDESGLSAAAVRDLAREHAAHVTNWYFWHQQAPQAEDRWAFLRWLEGVDGDADDVQARHDGLADGRTVSWGQLSLTVAVDDEGARTYEVRHEDDAGVDPAALERHEDPLDARELAKHDDRGRYRPLKTAPSLRTGWVFADLDARDLVRTVEFLYPATVANWYREREGTLDVTHWDETVERQTGIYGLVKTWNRGEGYEHVNWVAEACCVDSQCVKRREWDYDEETDLDVPRGDGAFPCREPCSIVLAASRQWTKLESEAPRTYEFELTPSEKEQIEAIIDAVAEGRVDDIREADVYEGANRYRTRFLRAKLFDEAGNLAGVPTGRDDGDEGGDGDGNEDGSDH